MTTISLTRPLAALLLCVVSVLSAAAQIEVSGGHISVLRDGSQLVFDLTGAPAYRSFLLPDPPRFVIDLQDTTADDLRYALHSPDVRDIRSGVRDGTLRIVLDLTRAMRTRVTLVQHHGNHLVLDLFRSQPPVFVDPAKVAFTMPRIIDVGTITKVVQTKPVLPALKLLSLDQTPSAAKPAITQPTRPAPPAAAKPSTHAASPHQNATLTTPVAEPQSLVGLHRRDIVIALDPGHGGKDTGAIGPDGIKEKSVVLAIAKRLKKLINAQSHLHAFLTRNRDIFIPLHERITIAQQHKADLFISIHANSTPERDSDTAGSMVFMLSTKGASSTLARWMAKSENDSDEIAGPLDVGDRQLRKVVFDIVHEAVLVDAKQLGEDVLQNLQDTSPFPLHTDRVERANFAVLKALEIPSILIETAFITNPTEEHQLANRRYQERLARAIAHGIEDYVESRPGLGLHIVDKSSIQTRPYTVHQGDTLSTIAQRYDVSLDRLITINGLNDAHYLPAGMTIQIPSS